MKRPGLKQPISYSKGALLVPLLMTLVFSFLTVKNPFVLDEFIETLLVDYRFKVRNFFSRPEAPEDIIIVTIDEKSLTDYGQWPWKRSLQARLIEKIMEGNPRVAGVDIFYSEPESPESDRVLAELFRKHKAKLVVALACEVEPGRKLAGEVEEVLYEIAIPKIRNVKLLKPIESFRTLLPPEPIRGSATFGHVYYLADRDGKLRWESLYLKYGDEYLPSFSVQVARLAMSLPQSELAIAGKEGVQLGEVMIPADDAGRLHINYLGREGTFRTVSASNVLSGSISNKIFQDKIVLVGTSAIATYDVKSTPFSANMTGVEKNATVVANIMGQDFLRRSPLIADLLAVLISGLLVVLLLPRMSALKAIIFQALLIALLLGANQFLFGNEGVRMNLLYPFMTLFASGTYIISNQYLQEEKRARKVRQMFSSYVTDRVVNELIRNPELAKLGGERREVTILFSDVRGFTAFSETHSPEEVVAILNEYLEAMTDVVFHWEGTLDKFVGDAIMAFWGAPLKQEDHAEHALRCALHMIQRLGELEEKWKSEGKEPLQIGIGINTGEVLVGNIGAEGKKMDYTAIGDHVNLAARMEGLTKKYQARILITENTLAKIRTLVKSGAIGHLDVKGLEQVIVKGKEESVGIYEIETYHHGEASKLKDHEKKVIRMKEK